MDVLVDSQSFIWFFENNPRLPASVRTYMETMFGNNLKIG